ncbi:hypothetical protein BH09MYX1_BH09MYX1_09260 [soil metagenome]
MPQNTGTSLARVVHKVGVVTELRPHVLLAEDDPQLRGLLEDELRRGGFPVTAAADGGVATELLELGELADGELHAVILDVNMPEASGIEIVAWLRSDARRIPVVIMSSVTEGLEEAGRAYGAVVLSKPFSIAQLETAVVEARVLALSRTMIAR